MKTNILRLVIIIISYNLGYTQSLSFNEPQPNGIYNFSKIDFCQVDEYTGKANITIPITILKLDDLDVPIALDYLMGGIKVDEYSTTVGLGWSLNAGCQVHKIVNQFEDNHEIFYWGGSESNGYLRNPNGGMRRDWPDEYVANLYGHRLKFMIKQDLSIAELESYGENKISYIRGLNDPAITSKYGYYDNYSGSRPVCGFTFLPKHILAGNVLNLSPQATPDGPNCYIHPQFTDTQSIQIIQNGFKYNFSDWDQTFNINMSQFDVSITQYHSLYHISDLTSLQSSKTINFEYDTVAYEDTNQIQQKDFNVFFPENNQGDTYIYSIMDDVLITSPNLYVKKRIKKILAPEVIIEFIYANLREDLKVRNVKYADFTHNQIIKEQYLSNIIVKNKNNDIINKFDFYYSYFDSGCSEAKCKRLKLDRIVKFGNNEQSNEQHSFTYYEDVRLPPVGFGKKDSFGYSNGLGDLAVTSLDIKKPKIYAYTENAGSMNEKTYYSPFFIEALHPVTFYGEDTSANLNYSRAWSLKSIKYPLGALQTFDYELNSFKWKDNVFEGGGLRIKKIDLLDNNIILSSNYDYNGDDNITSGNIIVAPQFNKNQFTFPQVLVNYSNSQNRNFYTTISSNGRIKTTKGANVGYKKVTVSKQNSGKIVRFFTNPATKPDANFTYLCGYYYPQELDFNSENFNTGFTEINNDFDRGLLLKEQVFNNSNVILKETSNKYQITVKDSLPWRYYYEEFPTLEFERYRSPYSTSWNGFGWMDHLMGRIQPKNTLFRNNNLIETTVKESTGSTIVEKQVKYIFNNQFNTLKKVVSFSSKGEIIEDKFYYPQDFNNYQQLINEGRMNQIIKKEKFINGIQVFESLVKFGNDNINEQLLLPTAYYELKGIGDITTNTQDDRKITYDKYDSNGNLNQYTYSDGLPISYIWGYNKTKIIAKIENLSYDIISQDLINAAQVASNNFDEQGLLAALYAIRSTIPATAGITTYTYKPLIGLSTIIDVKGELIIYTYDAFGRLHTIQDKIGNILSENTYHYKSQN